MSATKAPFNTSTSTRVAEPADLFINFARRPVTVLAAFEDGHQVHANSGGELETAIARKKAQNEGHHLTCLTIG